MMEYVMNLLSTNEICPLCNRKVDGFLWKHLNEDHFISLQSFLEMDMPEKSLLTYLDPELFKYELPDWGKKSFEYEQAKSLLRAEQHDFFSQLIGDRYLQMYICDDIYPEITMTHKYTDFTKVLRELKPLDRNKLWLVDFVPGYPKNICLENTKGLKIVDINDHFQTTSELEEISVNGNKIFLPEYVPYDHRHHSQFNVLNRNTEAKVRKRLRIDKEKCIKTISGKLFRFEGEGPLSKANLTVLKLVFMRNKNFMRTIIGIMEELSKVVGTLRDGIFMRNTVVFDYKNPICVSVGWTQEEAVSDKYIKLSIL